MSDTFTAPVTIQPDPPKRSRRYRLTRSGIVLAAGLIILAGIGDAMGGTQASPAAAPRPAVTVTAAPRPAVTVTAAPRPAVTITARPKPAVTVTRTAAPAQASTAPAPAAPASVAPAAMTASEQQAVDAAQGYLNLDSGFSQYSLTRQLTSSYGSGFSAADAQYAISYLAPDWDAQAAEAAKGYMALGGFSAASLTDQLTSDYGDGFTEAQAEYGVAQAGL